MRWRRKLKRGRHARPDHPAPGAELRRARSPLLRRQRPPAFFDPPEEPEPLVEYSIWERPTAELIRREEPEPPRPAAKIAGALREARSTAGATDGRAVAVLAQRSERGDPASIELEPRLAQIGGCEPSLDHYDQLLVKGGSR